MSDMSVPIELLTKKILIMRTLSLATTKRGALRIISFESIYKSFYPRYSKVRYEKFATILLDVLRDWKDRREEPEFWKSNYFGYILSPAPGIMGDKYSVRNWFRKSISADLFVIYKVRVKPEAKPSEEKIHEKLRELVFSVNSPKRYQQARADSFANK